MFSLVMGEFFNLVVRMVSLYVVAAKTSGTESALSKFVFLSKSTTNKSSKCFLVYKNVEKGAMN